MIRKKRMSKGIAKILSGLLVFGMVAGLVPAVPGGTVHAKAEGESEQNVTAEAHTHCVCGTGELSVEGHERHEEETWIGISDFREIDISTMGYYYYLKDDVTIDQVWKCPRGVTLCLNGHSITRTSVNTDSAPYEKAVIYTNSKFTLTDCKKNGIIKHEVKNTGAGVYNFGDFTMFNGNMSDNYHGVSSDGTFQMYGGTISGNAAEVGGGVYNDGTFNMYGGTITDNQESAYGGGGVYNVKTFNMFGGTITKNHGSNNGGGVYNGETFNMYGGEITANTTTNDGGGVYIFKGTFTMSGGQIANNKARRGGGVYNDGGKFTMSDETISKNEAMYGGGVYNEGGTFEMSGGTISGNTADSSNGYPAGGGVYNQVGTFTMSGGAISGNTAKSFGGGVYKGGGTFTMSGGAITGNTSEKSGGGVHNAASGPFEMSGAVKITENTVRGIANNLYLKSGTTVEAGTLTEGTKIGVTTEETPKENSPVTITSDAANEEYFKSDNSAYEIGTEDGKVVLKTKQTIEAPTITTQPQPVSVKAGEEATFTVNATGTDLKYQWQVNKNDNAEFVNIDGATSESYKFNVASAEFNGYQYKCVVSNQSGSVTSNPATLTVTEDTTPVTYIITPTAGINGRIFPSDPVTVQDGGNQTFKFTPDSGYEIASLIVDGAKVENLSDTYTFTDVRSTHTIEVSFKKQDDTPSTVEAPKIITQPQPVSVKAGEEATFTVNATGTDLKYQWQVNKNDNAEFVNIDGATRESYKFNVASAEFNGYQYQCVVSNQSGSVTSASVILNVTENSTPTPEPNPEPNPNPEPTPTPTPTPNPTPEATTPTPDPAPATSTPAASTTAAPAAAAPAQVTYDILDGAGSSWTQNTDGSLAIRGSGEISKFREVKVDGVTVDPVNYTVTEGSTIITFKPEYLKSLSAGNHSFELVWTDGTAATNFTVAENADQSAKSPKTGEDFSMALCTALLMVSCVGLAGMFVRRKKSSLR